MRKLLLPLLLAGAATIAGCNTVEGMGEDLQSAANAFEPDPARTYAPCGSYGMMDRDNDGFVSQSEWNSYRAGAYGAWDANADGRISRNEFGTCWYGGGFYTGWDRDAYDRYWSMFDANNDGYLSSSEYYSAASWARLDVNGNGRIDTDEWRWW